MSSKAPPPSTSQGLAFLALLSFVAAFFAARVFTTISPTTVVVTGGVHFHHFWYGLGMIAAAGWLGISTDRPEYNRGYAVVFGLGLGLIGDETGLLLTFGDYHSQLTYFFFVATVTLAVLGILAARYWREVKEEVIRLGHGERAVHIGEAICGLSFLPLAFGYYLPGALTFALGFVIAIAGVWIHRRRLHYLVPSS